MTDDADPCHYCTMPATTVPCGAFMPSVNGGYVCSRPKGHDGPHVACGSILHCMEKWEQEEEAHAHN